MTSNPTTSNEIHFRPIGIIHSPFHEKTQTPIQPPRSTADGWVEVFSEYAEGLDDLDGFSHIFLLYQFDRSQGYALRVQPFLDDQPHGLFSTRHPCRPNPLGLSIVRLVSRQANLLQIAGVDVLDGTPLLDIKPYVPEFDAHPQARSGWHANRSKD